MGTPSNLGVPFVSVLAVVTPVPKPGRPVVSWSETTYNAASHALEDAVAELTASVRQIAVLHEATHMILAGGADLETILHQVLLVVRNHFSVSKCAVFTTDETGDHVRCRVQNGYDPRFVGTRFRIGAEGIVGWVAYSRMPAYVPDVSKEPRYFCADPATRSELALPLLARDELLGVLDVASDEPDFFSNDTTALLALFAGQASVAMDNARLYMSERRRMRQIELINLIARSATAAVAVDQFATTLAELICDSFEGADSAVLLRQGDGGLRLAARAGANELVTGRLAASQREGILREALNRHHLVQAPDLSPETPGCFAESGSELVIPLESAGETLGAILVGHTLRHAFTADDCAIAQAAADVAATSIRNVLLGDELQRVANTDFLTGVFNQRYFRAMLAEEVARSKRYNKHFAVAMLDLHEFRKVNAAIGFDGADELLRRLARTLTTQMRRSDVVCRFAGDRFALVLPETDPELMEAVLTKIRASLGEIQYPVAGGQQRLAAAFASAHFPQDGSTDVELIRALLARAQAAKQQSSAAEA